MTKEEALKEIDERYRFWQKHYAPECEKYGEALGLAIEALKKLQHYEDLEEAGRLVILPCKVGDWVYKVHYKEIRRHHVCQVHIGQTPAQTFFSCYGEYLGIEEFGKTVFLTREEAEAALKGGDLNE